MLRLRMLVRISDVRLLAVVTSRDDWLGVNAGVWTGALNRKP